MSLMVAAGIGSALASAYGAYSSKKDSDRAYGQAQESLDKQLGKIDEFSGLADSFAKAGQANFDKYQNMFGGFEENLNDYYMGLDANELAARGNQNAQQQYQQAMSQVNDQMAAQGITGSGIQSQLGMQGATDMAQQKAQNITNAPHQVAQMQQGWMNYGAGRQDQGFNQMQQGVNMQGNVANMYNNAYGAQANQYNQMGANNLNQAQQGAQGIASGLASAAYFSGKG